MKPNSFNLTQYLNTIPSNLWNRNLPALQKRVTLNEINFHNLSRFNPENCLSLLIKTVPLIPQNWEIKKVDYMEGLQSQVPHLYAVYTLRPPVKPDKTLIKNLKNQILQTEDYTGVLHKSTSTQLSISTTQKA